MTARHSVADRARVEAICAQAGVGSAGLNATDQRCILELADAGVDGVLLHRLIARLSKTARQRARINAWRARNRARRKETS